MNIRILLADDHKLMREGLRTLIEEQPEMTVAAEAENGRSAVRLAAELSPDIIIMDISMPGMNGIEATRKIMAADSAAKIIALSMHLDRRMVLEMLNAGATGYLLKDCAFDEVILAIQTVASHCTYLSPKIIDIILRDYILRLPKDELSALTGLTAQQGKVIRLLVEGKETEEIASLLHIKKQSAESQRRQIILEHILPSLHKADRDALHEPAVCLTAREKEILQWIKDGKSSWDISRILGISENTVKFHLRNIFLKLDVSSRAQAITVAIENKLLDT